MTRKNHMRYPTFKSIINDINKSASMLKEDYVFNDHQEGDEEMYGNEEGYGDEMHHGEEEGEQRVENNGAIQQEPIIEKIREIAIDGLKKYSEQPTSPIYEFFKKVFLDADKVITEGLGASNK